MRYPAAMNPPVAPARLPVVDPDRCTGCGRCVAACDPRVLSLETVAWRKRAVLDDAASCTGCSLCAVRCPFGAIRMKRPERPAAA